MKLSEGELLEYIANIVLPFTQTHALTCLTPSTVEEHQKNVK